MREEHTTKNTDKLPYFLVKYPNIKYFKTVHSLPFQLRSCFAEDGCPSSQESSSSKNSMGTPTTSSVCLSVCPRSPRLPVFLGGCLALPPCGQSAKQHQSNRKPFPALPSPFPAPPPASFPGLSREFWQDQEGRKRKPP